MKHTLTLSTCLLLTLALTAPAVACKSIITISKDRAHRLLVQAQEHLDKGEYRKAASKAIEVEDGAKDHFVTAVQEVLPNKSWDQNSSRRNARQNARKKQRILPLVPRARVIKAIATIRLGGDIIWFINADKIPSAKGRQAQLGAAINIIRQTLKETPNDPILLTALGEGLSHQGVDQRAEALETLTDLETRDLIVAPEGYEALAKLRHDLQDTDGRDLALRRCRAMNADPDACMPQIQLAAGERLTAR